MRKATQLMMTLLLLMAGVVSASAKSYTADLDPSMFKAWDGYLPGANVVAEPETIDDGTKFECTYNLYKEIGAGGMVYGNTNVYYLWYADITGTKTLTIEGTKGLQLRVLFNRPEPEEGGTDAHGGKTTEIQVTLDDNGKAVVDLSGYEYVHLNAIKAGWGSPAGTVRKLELEGSVKPVTGWVDILDNGDFEGTELKNFVVALDAVKDQGTHEPSIVDGVGVDGSRAIVVKSMDEPTESWQTQFFIRFDEFLPEGTEWKLSMDIKADHDADCGGGCHAEPRSYLDGSMFDPNPKFTTEWTTFTASGKLKKYGDDGLGSIAFDLNVDAAENNYYFDNVSFQIWKQPVTPVSLVKAAFSQDVVRVDFGNPTNMKDLVAAAGGERVVFPNDCVKLSVNGQPSTLMSVEGRRDGYLYIFIDDNYAEGEDDVVSVSFTNPADKALHLTFTDGKFAGEDCPDFVDVIATLEEGLEENYSYLLDNPAIVTAEPENGSFNLDGTLKEFKFTFNHPVKCDALTAKLNKEALTVAPATGFSNDITLTRTGSNELKGEYTLTLSNVQGERILDVPAEYELTYSFGAVVIDPNDQPKDFIDPALFADCPNGGIPTGFLVNFNGEEREGGTTGLGSGPRMFDFDGDGGDFAKGLYFRQGFVEYGSMEGFALSLEAGKKYSMTFNAAQWKDNAKEIKFEVFSAEDTETPLFTETIAPAFNVNGVQNIKINGSTAAKFTFIPEESGDFVIRWTDAGYNETLLGNPQVKYVPSVLGAEEIQNLTAALEEAKAALANNSDARYAGEAYNTLDATIKEYDGKVMTAPSEYNKGVELLKAATKAMTDHRTLCDTYDPLPVEAQDAVLLYADTKFAKHPIFANLKAAAEKYADKVLMLDDELTVAIDELQGNLTKAKEMFTEGPSAVGDWSSTRTGIAPLVERIRLGAETLKQLGVAEDDPYIVAANTVLTDDDALAEDINRRITQELYGKLKDKEDIFAPVVDEEGNETETEIYLTSFVKNPNIYKISDGNGYKEDAVPGWTVENGRGFSTGWNTYGSAEVPVDCMFSNWGGDFRVYQEVTNLPAGVYTLKAGYGERMSEDESADALDGTYFYVKTSDMVDDSLTIEAQRIGQSFPNLNLSIEDVVVTDGQLTLGVSAGSNSHVFFDAVAVQLTAAANGFDYNKAWADGIETLDNQTAKVRAIELFDLNGRRITSVRSGVAIVKKHMSDGTVRTEKVLKK